MMHSPAEVLKWLLIQSNQGTDPTLGMDWPISASGEPDLPDGVITIYNTQGLTRNRLGPTGRPQGANGIQVRIRTSSAQVAYAKAKSVWDFLSLVLYTNVTIGTGTVSHYLVPGLVNFGDIIDLFKQVPATRRSLFTFNCLIHVVPLS